MAPPIGGDLHLALWATVAPSLPPPASGGPTPGSFTRTAALRVGGLALAALLAIGAGACGTTTGNARPARTAALAESTSKQTTAAERVAANEATVAFRSHLGSAASSFVDDVGRLQNDLQAGDVGAARLDELAAQAQFDQFRQVAGGDPVNASALDELASEVGPGQTFGGLHAIERDLWGESAPGSGGAAASGDVAQAISDASGLMAQAPVAEFLLSKGTLRPEAIGVTAVDDLGWVNSVAIPGDEELYSHLDAVDIAAGIEAADEAYDIITPLATLVAPGLTATVGQATHRTDG